MSRRFSDPNLDVRGQTPAPTTGIIRTVTDDGVTTVRVDLSALADPVVWRRIPAFLVQVAADGSVTTDAEGFPPGYGCDPTLWEHAHACSPMNGLYVSPDRQCRVLDRVKSHFERVAAVVAEPPQSFRAWMVEHPLTQALRQDGTITPAEQWRSSPRRTPTGTRRFAVEQADRQTTSTLYESLAAHVTPSLRQDVLALMAPLALPDDEGTAVYNACVRHASLRRLLETTPVAAWLMARGAAAVSSTLQDAEALEVLMEAHRPATTRAWRETGNVEVPVHGVATRPHPSELPVRPSERAAGDPSCRSPLSPGFHHWAAKADFRGGPLYSRDRTAPRAIAVAVASMGDHLTPAHIDALRTTAQFDRFHALALEASAPRLACVYAAAPDRGDLILSEAAVGEVTTGPRGMRRPTMRGVPTFLEAAQRALLRDRESVLAGESLAIVERVQSRSVTATPTTAVSRPRAGRGRSTRV